MCNTCNPWPNSKPCFAKQCLDMAIALADTLSNQIQQIRELHKMDKSHFGYCDQCQSNWPCKTINRLDGNDDE